MDEDRHWLVVTTVNGDVVTHKRFGGEAWVEAQIAFYTALLTFPLLTVILYDMASGRVTRHRRAPARSAASPSHML